MARRDQSAAAELLAELKEHRRDLMSLDRRIEKLESRIEDEIDAYIRRLNAASRKYLKAERERAMRLLPGEGQVHEPGPDALPAEPAQGELYMSPKQHIRHRVKERRAQETP